MAKTKISEFSSTAGNNTDIDSINISEGCAPSSINNAIRELMAQLKDFQAGTAGDSFNGPIGTTTAAAGAFTTLAASGAVTLSGGTANGVAYLNGSKVLTTGSALTFDGTNLSNTRSVATAFSGSNSATWANGIVLSNTATPAAGVASLITFGGTNNVNSVFGVAQGSNGYGDFVWAGYAGSFSEQMRLTSTGLGIGTSSPQWKLDVQTTQSRFQVRDGANTGGTSAGTGLVSINATATALDSFNYRATAHAFIVDASEAMRLTSTGLGIGTSSPAVKLETSSTSAGATVEVLRLSNPGAGANTQAQLKFFTTSTNYGTISGGYGVSAPQMTFDLPNGTPGNYVWQISSSEKMRLTSTGLGIGTSSPNNTLQVNTGVVGVSTPIRVSNSSATTNGRGAGLEFVGSSNTFGRIEGFWAGADEQIRLFSTGSMTFASGGTTERLRITSSGNVLINRTSATGALSLEVQAPTGFSIGSGFHSASTQSTIEFKDSTTTANYKVRIGSAGDNLLLFAGGSERARITSSGSVGIGTSSPAEKLDVAGTVRSTSSLLSDTGIATFGSWTRIQENGFYDAGGNFLHNAIKTSGANDTWNYVFSGAPVARYKMLNGVHSWYNAPSGTAGNAISFSQVMTLDASGNLALGATSTLVAGTPERLRVAGSTPTTGAGAYPGTMVVSDTRAYNSSSPPAGGGIAFSYKYNAGGADAVGPSIQGFKENTTDDDYAGGLRFFTRANGANPAERARVDSSGRLLVGTTTESWTNTNAFIFSPTAGDSSFTHSSSKVNGDAFQWFIYNAGIIGSITQNGTTAVAYNTSSDYRLKNITGPITTSGAYIDSLNPVEGTWKADGSTFVGLIAHEVQEASRTNVATGVKDGEQMQGMDYSSAEIIANLIAEVKALRTRVAALESI